MTIVASIISPIGLHNIGKTRTGGVTVGETALVVFCVVVPNFIVRQSSSKTFIYTGTLKGLHFPKVTLRQKTVWWLLTPMTSTVSVKLRWKKNVYLKK